MPKLKTCRAAAKRFSLTKSGKLKRAKAYRRHILNKKSPKTKRNLRQPGLVSASDTKRILTIMPYK